MALWIAYHTNCWKRSPRWGFMTIPKKPNMRGQGEFYMGLNSQAISEFGTPVALNRIYYQLICAYSSNVDNNWHVS